MVNNNLSQVREIRAEYLYMFLVVYDTNLLNMLAVLGVRLIRLDWVAPLITDPPLLTPLL